MIEKIYEIRINWNLYLVFTKRELQIVVNVSRIGIQNVIHLLII